MARVNQQSGRHGSVPAPRKNCFIMILSMPMALPATPVDVYGRFASSSIPCSVPSSPFSPCMTITQTSSRATMTCVG